MEIPHMRRFFDRAGPDNDSRIAPQPVLPSANSKSVGAPDSPISRLNSPACAYPCQRFACALTNADA
jgi:hypothetical protein